MKGFLSIKNLTVSQIQELDRWAIEKIGISSLALMENAGRLVSEKIHKRLRSKKRPSVVIVCGVGNNGGDGFVIARYLVNNGYNLSIFLVGNVKELKTDALANYHVLRNLNIPVKSMEGLDPAFLKSIKRADLIVDAIFGVGLNRPIEEPFLAIINAINAQDSYVVSVDVPSGLDGTTGEIYGVCIKANVTVTFSYLKRGFLKKHGPLYVGRCVVVDIGIPSNYLGRQ